MPIDQETTLNNNTFLVKRTNTIKFITIFISLFIVHLQASEKIKLQLKWFSAYQFAGYYMALEKGYYKEAGLDVEIIERDPLKNNIEQVINGEAHYGVADSAILLYRAKGKPVKIIASIFQHSPIVYVTKRDSNIFSPYEMKGKIISYQKDLNDALLVAMLENAGISEKDYTHKPLDFSSKEFIDGNVDVISVYLSDQPFYFKNIGLDINIINPLNYGFDFYGDNLFTTEDEINNHPKRAEAFKNASLKGWEYALSHIDETIKILKKRYGAKSSIEHLKYEAKVTKQMIMPHIIPLGDTDINRFYRIAQTYTNTKKASKKDLDKALEELIYKPKDQNVWHRYFYITLIMLLGAIGLTVILYLINNKLKKLVKEKTKEQQTLLSLFDHGDSVLFKWIDFENWETAHVSSNVANLLGYTKDELLNKDISYKECIHKDDFQRVISEIDKAKHKKDVFFKHKPYRVITKNGDIKWILNYTVLDKKDEKINFLGYLIDISHQENSLRKLEKFIDTQDAIVVLTNAEEMSFANKKLFEFLDYKDLESFKTDYRCISELFIQNDRFFYRDKLDDGKNWIEQMKTMYHSERIVSIMGGDFKIHAFSVTIKEFEEGISIVTLTNISQTMMEHIKLEEKTIRDKLTNAYNREYFELNYQSLIEQYTQSGYQFGLAVLDIDHFKSVNDTYGHDVGDYVLEHFVKIIHKFSRDEDTLIRWGGEEFILILKVRSKEDLSKALEHIRKVIELEKFKTVGHKTCSIGGTLYQNNESIEKTIKRADEGVYEAKSNGRNQVIIY